MNTENKKALNTKKGNRLRELRGKHRSGYLKYIVIILILSSCITAYMKMKTQEKKPEVIQYKTEEVKRGDITVIVTATGTLDPTKEVEVGSELSGTVKTVKVNYNDKVKVGQVLATIDTTKLEAQVKQSKASLEASKAKVEEIKVTIKETQNKLEQYKKVRELSGGKVPAQTEYDAADAAYERAKADEANAQASVSQAEAALNALQTDLGKSVIVSPINGIVLSRDIEPGQTVAASFQAPVLFTLAEDLTKMELHVDVDEADVGQIKDGQDATFTVDAYPNRKFSAKIIQTRYNAQTVDGVVTYETVLQVDNSDLSLRPGMTATSDIVVSKVENVVKISNAALRFTMPEKTETKKSTSVLSAILPHPPTQKKNQKVEKIIKEGEEETLWILKDGKPEQLKITTGLTDGVAYEMKTGELQEGMALITDILN